jgi:hypothetical protein
MGPQYDSVRLCLAKDACQGGEDPEEQCRRGHKGPYCSVCEDNYYKHGGVCLKCSTSGARLIVSLLPTLSILFCLFLYYLWIIRDRFVDYFWNQAGHLAKKAETYHLGAVKTKFKIILAFVQIINQIPFALDVDFPQIYLKFLDILWLFNLDFVEFVNFECIYKRNFYDKLVESTLGPFIIMGLVVTVLFIRQFIAFRLNNANPSYTYDQFRKESIFCALLLSFIVFSPVSIKVFQTFACENFDDGSSRMIADYTVHCSGSEYNFYTVYAIIMVLIYPLGVPLMYFTLLYLNRDRVNPPSRLVVRDAEKDLVSNSIIQQEKMKLRNSYEDIFIISFLYMTYEPQRWYFEILDCFRRLMLTAVPVLIMRGAITQIVIVLMVSLACVAAYMELKPYTTKSDNSVAVLSQWAITLTLIVSILIRISEDQGLNRQTLGIIAIFINSLVFVVTLLLIFVNDDEIQSSDEVRSFETQSAGLRGKATKKKSNMKLSHFIVELTQKRKSQSKVAKGQSENLELVDSASERPSFAEKIKFVNRKSEAIEEKNDKESNSTDLTGGRSNPNSTARETDIDNFELNRAKLVLRQPGEVDSDDEPDSDDDQGDSDDDSPKKTHHRGQTNGIKPNTTLKKNLSPGKSTVNPLQSSSHFTSSSLHTSKSPTKTRKNSILLTAPHREL